MIVSDWSKRDSAGCRWTIKPGQPRAARLAYHGVGEFVEIGNLTARHLSELIVKLKANPNYRDKARWFQKVLGETRGLDVAADIYALCP